MIGRRSFITSTLGFLAGAALDPEKLLWVPGRKSIFVPPAVVMPNLDEINRLTLKYIVPGLVDNVFANDPLLAYMSARDMTGGADSRIQEAFFYR